MSQLYENVNLNNCDLLSDRRIPVCMFPNERHTSPTSLTMSWSGIVERHSLHDVREKKSGSMIGGYELNGKRCDQNVVRRTLIQLDIDTKASMDDATGAVRIDKRAPEVEEVALRLRNYEFFAVSTHLHNPKAGIVKYRVVLLPNRDITNAEDYRLLLEGLDHHLNGVLDRNAWQFSQAFYLPSCQPQNAADRFFVHNRGVMFDVQSFIEKGREISRAAEVSSPRNWLSPLSESLALKPRTFIPKSQENIDKLLSALRHLDPDISRGDWLRVIWSIHAHGWDIVYEIARQWSERGIKFDPESFDKDFYSFDSQRSDSVSTGTLYYMAKQAGWHDSGPVDEANEGDLWNSRKFCQLFREQLRFVHPPKKWLAWDGSRWVYCEAKEEFAAAKKVADLLWDEASRKYRNSPNDPEVKRLLAHARRSQDEKRLIAMINLATSEPEIAIGDVNHLDSQHLLLGVKNGVVNLEHGTLLRSEPGFLMTKQCSVEFDPHAVCPRWLAFLNEVFLGDEHLISYIQRALGYSMTGRVDEEVLFFMFGSGANGKSVFVNTICNVLNDYAGTAPSTLLSLKRNDDGGRATPEMARLAGVRFALVNETQSGDRLDEQMVKVLVSRERIAARFLHRDYFEFWPTHCLWLRSNHKPIITGDDDGIWRRIHLIPFDRRFQPEEMDRNLEEALRHEAAGILAWMVRGAREWLRDGLTPPERVLKAGNEYRKESDILGQWLEDCADTSQKDFRNDEQLIYQSYKGWCLTCNCRPMSKAQFTRKLAERGISQGWVGKMRVYVGLRLKLTAIGAD